MVALSQIEAGTPCAVDTLDRIEGRTAWKLPEAFRDFANSHGDAFVGGSLGQNPVLCFLDLATDLARFDEYLEVGTVPFARCDMGGIYGMKSDGTVWYLLVHLGEVTLGQVAASFDEFLEGIEIEE